MTEREMLTAEITRLRGALEKARARLMLARTLLYDQGFRDMPEQITAALREVEAALRGAGEGE